MLLFLFNLYLSGRTFSSSKLNLILSHDERFCDTNGESVH